MQISLRSRVQSGFTLIEIVIAMALFSLFMIATLGSLGALSKIYQHGIATRRATDNSRLLIEDVSRVVRFADNASATGDPGTGSGTSSYPFPQVAFGATVTCGPNLNLYTAVSQSTPEYQFVLTSTNLPNSPTTAQYQNANYVVNFVNNTLPSGAQSAYVTQSDGTTIDITKANAFGVTGSYPGAYLFCVYNNPPFSYVKISFTINNSSTIKGPFLLFNVNGSGVNQGIEFTTTVGIGGAGQ